MATNADISIASGSGLVSILIPCTGMLAFTKLCVPSLLKHTRLPFELIFLDVGSLDGTAEYLAGLRTGLAGRVRVEVARAPTDLGIKNACRKALAQASGEYIVLLNNDTIVTNGWLQQMLGLASFSTAIGLVGPMSNYAAPPQLVETVPYRMLTTPKAEAGFAENGLLDVSHVEKFAVEYRQRNQGNWMYGERLGGFCLLLKREVLDKIGPGMDEWTDLSLFDSDIVSTKAQQVGFSLAVCRDLFVHHFGTRTFAHGAKSANTASS